MPINDNGLVLKEKSHRIRSSAFTSPASPERESARIAGMLKAAGYNVGSDANVYPPMSNMSRARGIDVMTPYAADSVDVRCCVRLHARPRETPWRHR
jgi:hypothetical protein